MPAKKPASPASNEAVTAAISGNSLKVYDTSGKAIEFGKVVMELTSATGGNSAVTTCRTVADLRQTEPTAVGELAVVLEYSENHKMGGGVFVYDISDTTTPDDNGVNFVTAKGARWKRALTDHNALTVVDFGALADGKTDCIDAVKYMWAWSKKYNPEIGIKFPAGKFMMSKFDISDATPETPKFRVSGQTVTFGYLPATTLLSDRKDGEVMFKVKARYTEISSLIIDGENNKAKNTKGFYQNIVEAGQFVRVSCVMFYNMGGKSISMLDTLDCKIDQWYARDCYDSVIHATWSDNPQGKWDHITAIELTNFNIQRSKEKPAIDLQRSGQSFIWNGWIEHSDDPGTIANGHWTINGLNIETCKAPLKCHYSRIINLQHNEQNNKDAEGKAFTAMDFSQSGDRWEAISLYEQGDVRIENHGVRINGSLNYQYLTSPDRMFNSGNDEKWFYVGELLLTQNSFQAHLRVIGSATFTKQDVPQLGFSENTAEGAADIFIQKVTRGFISSWSGQGASPVKRVMLQAGSSSSHTKLYVKLAKLSNVVALLDTNANDRYTGGVHFMFNKGYRAATPEESATLEAALTDTNVYHQHWVGNNSVGFGFNHDNELLLQGKTLASTQTGTANKVLKVYVNGVAYGLELKPLV
ncbi:hypothetical protein [Erwinia aphidicola]|jgi:amylovoran biosynthesis protein AmsF|uniref:hypothetical protein n=1 Tax=Erwinia aphidicola TaxID=68334 RepID=UPI00300D4D88